ncbi:hypothetical protein [Hanstruepera ponticola]|uniref:hypothetical protein n=1 Tax=Hanstruepera ponticola TaxID=2042995 RepID=UPI00177E5899|nr:hypothetical protein [Hanstruepera ponticola]
MNFEKSNYFKLLNHKKLALSFGDFYLMNRFIISELHEGIHFDWDKIQVLAAELIRHYGYGLKIGYISNRINPYSLDPHLWTQFNQEFGFIIASAAVVYDDISYMNATLEKQFTSNSLKRCSSLEEAIYWMQNIEEFKI